MNRKNHSSQYRRDAGDKFDERFIFGLLERLNDRYRITDGVVQKHSFAKTQQGRRRTTAYASFHPWSCGYPKSGTIKNRVPRTNANTDANTTQYGRRSGSAVFNSVKQSDHFWRSANLAGTGIWTEWGVGANGDAVGKISDFNSKMRAGLGSRVNIAFFKFCFVDFDPWGIFAGCDGTSDPYLANPKSCSYKAKQLFEQYKATMAALKTTYPSVTFVHFTEPAETQIWVNEPRETYNALLRTYYAGKEPVFDIAVAESTHDDLNKTRCFDQSIHSAQIPALCPEYSSDGGHLSDQGQNIVSRALIKFLAELP